MRRFIILVAAVCLLAACSGCGETINGIGNDVSRMGRGVRTIFVRDSAE